MRGLSHLKKRRVEHYWIWLTKQFFLVGLATKMDHWWFQKFDMFELFKYRNGMMIPNDALFSVKNTKQIFSEVVRSFFF